MDDLKEILDKKMVRKRWEIGEKYEVEVIGRSKEYVYVDYGDKKEGLIDIKEFVDNEGNMEIIEGKKIEAYYLGTTDGFKRFTTLYHGFSTLDLKRIRDAYEGNSPIEGKVINERKGGFEIGVGSVRCFCPYSQIGEKDEPRGNLLGKILNFKVLVFEDDGKNIVLSRKVLLQEEKEQKKRELKDTIKKGSKVTGIVKRITEAGATIDLGGMEAFLPRSEISWTYVKDIRDLLTPETVIEAKVKEVDWDNERIILSIRELFPDPYAEFEKKYERGCVIEGTVSKIEPFGVFVTIEQGLEGFVHVSRLGLRRRIKDPGQFFKEGQKVEVEVLDVDLTKRRISLAIKEEADQNLPYPKVGEMVECNVIKIVQKGILVEINDGIIGYIPDSEMHFTGEKAKSKYYAVGSNLKAVVIDIDRERGRVLLSEKKVEEFEEKEAYLAYSERLKTESPSLGSLGELIKERLK